MDTMAIAGMATELQAAKLQQAVGTSVMKMGMDVAKDAGQAVVEMMNKSLQGMERSVNPHLGSILDIMA